MLWFLSTEKSTTTNRPKPILSSCSGVLSGTTGPGKRQQSGGEDALVHGVQQKAISSVVENRQLELEVACQISSSKAHLDSSRGKHCRIGHTAKR